jgi:hypothetical protein
MTIGYDAASIVNAGSGSLNWIHSPVGVPKGIVVMVVEYVSGVDGVTGVTYGGLAMTEIANSPALAPFGEHSAVHIFHLGENIPPGDQTVTVSISGAVTRRAVAVSFTANTNRTKIVDSKIFQSVGSANPSVTLSHNGQVCFDLIAGVSGVQTAGEVAELSGWGNIAENDFGNAIGVWYVNGLGGSSDVTAGWTAAEDDVNFIALSIGEPVGPFPVSRRNWWLL